MTTYATYVRVSTTDQDPASYYDELEQWMHDHGVDEWERFADIAKSGSDPGREQLRALLDRVRADEFDEIVTHEVSRLARRTHLSVEFVQACMEHDVDIVLLDDLVDRITHTDPSSQMLATMSAAIYQHELDQLIRRVKRGQRRAAREGKWIGQPPLGFRTDDEGYLTPILDAADGETSYFRVADALERVEDGASYRSVATETGINRVTLMDIHKDADRRRWYLDTEADDEKVDAALEELRRETE